VGVVLGFIFHNANKLPNVLGYGNWVDPAEQWVATPRVWQKTIIQFNWQLKDICHGIENFLDQFLGLMICRCQFGAFEIAGVRPWKSKGDERRNLSRVRIMYLATVKSCAMWMCSCSCALDTFLFWHKENNSCRLTSLPHHPPEHHSLRSFEEDIADFIWPEPLNSGSLSFADLNPMI
jgi:hypothetical protein